MLLELPDELLGLVLDATENPMGLRLASKRFASMPRGKAKVCELQRRELQVPEGTLSRAEHLLRLAVAKVVRRISENAMNQALQLLFPDREHEQTNFLTGPDETWWRLDT